MAGKHRVNSSAQPSSKAGGSHLRACLNLPRRFLLLILRLLQLVQPGADLTLCCCAFLLMPDCQGLAGLASLVQLLLGDLQQRQGCQSACHPRLGRLGMTCTASQPMCG